MRRLGLLCLVVFGLSLGLFSAELLARLFLPVQQKRIEIPSIESEVSNERLLFYRYHPILGYDGIPNKKQDFHFKPHSLNRRGERGRAFGFAKPPETKRVVLLGDSQTFGYAEADKDTIDAMLQRRFDAEGVGFEVINQAAIGYTIDQELLKLLVSGLRYSPDYVVLQFFEGNDIWELSQQEAWGVKKPFFFLRGDQRELCLGGVPVPRASGWPENQIAERLGLELRAPRIEVFGREVALPNSRLIEFFAAREIRPVLESSLDFLRREFKQTEDYALLSSFLPCIDPNAPYVETAKVERLGLYERLVTKMQSIAKVHGFKLALALVPDKALFESGATGQDYIAVRKIARDLGVRVIDVDTIARERKLSPAQLHEWHSHLTVLGNQMIADEVYSWALSTDSEF